MRETGVAIVTGASRGIGAEIAKRLGRDGFAVVVNFVAVEREAELVAETITAAGGRAVCAQGDVAKRSDVKRIFDRAEMEFGPATVVVNSAGVAPPSPTPLLDLDEDTFDHILDVNVRGTFHVLREAGERLDRGGRIVTLGSSVVELGHSGFSVYAASKAAVSTMSKIFARELRGREINVNTISPGPVRTDFFLHGKSEETIRFYAQLTPYERLGTPDEIADVIAFLVGPDGRWVNGQNIIVNGGMI